MHVLLDSILLDNVSTDQSSPVVEFNRGEYWVFVDANDMGGATVNIQASAPYDDLNRFSTLDNGTITQPSRLKILLPDGVKIKAVLSGTTGTTASVRVSLAK